MKNLEALQNLKTSAKEQNEELMNTIEEIHNQRLDSIQISLTNTLREKLNLFNLNIQEELKQKKQIPVDNNGSNKSNSISYIHDILFSVAKSNAKFTNLANTYRFTIYRAKPEVHQSTKKRDTSISRPNNNIHQNQGIKNDSIGTTTKSRIRKEREAQYRAYLKNRKTRDTVYQQIVGDTESLRNKFAEYSEQQYRNKQSIFRKIGAIGRIIARFASELKRRIEGMKISTLIKPNELGFITEIDSEFDKKVRRKK